MTENNSQENTIRRKGRGFFTKIPGVTDNISASALNNEPNLSASALNKQSNLSASALNKESNISASALNKQNLGASASNKQNFSAPALNRKRKEETDVEKLLEETEEEKEMTHKQVTESMEKLLLEEEMEVDEWGTKDTWDSGPGSSQAPKFENEGFKMVEKKKNKEKLKETFNVVTSAKKDRKEPSKGKRFVIAQVQEKRLIAVAPSPNQGSSWPFFIEIPDSLEIESERPLYLGDSVYVTNFEWIENRRHLEMDTWMYQSRINFQATATEIIETQLAPWIKNTGFTFDLKRRKKEGSGPKSIGSARVIAFGLERGATLTTRQCLDFDLSELKRGQLIDLQLAHIPEGWLIAAGYILPPGSYLRHGTEMIASGNSHVLGVASLHKENWRFKTPNGQPTFFPITPEYTNEEIDFAENIMAAALIVASEIDETARIETLFQGTLGLRTKEERRNFYIAFETTDRSFSKKVCDVWTKDTAISAKMNYGSKAFAQGVIKEIMKKCTEDNLIVIEIDIFLIPHLEAEQEDDFEAMIQGEDVIIITSEGGGGLRAQSETLGFHLASQIMEREESKRAEILKSLFARRGTDEKVKGGKSGESKLEWRQQLNDQQQETIENWLNEGAGRVHFQQAPPGTGKTRVAAACIAAIVHQNPDCAVLATSGSNLPVSKLTEEAARTLPDQDMIAFFSGMAKVRYSEHIALLENHLLATKINKEGYQNKLEPGQARDVKIYLEKIEKHPKQAAERKVGAVLQKTEFRNVVFATIHMALSIPGAHVTTTHLVVDEVTQVSFTSMVHLLCQMPNVASVLLTGDRRQIGTHLNDLPDLIHEGFGLESLTTQIQHCPRISTTTLIYCYRAHPTLVECFDYASYRQHNERVIPAIAATERRGLTDLGINLPVSDIPLILLNICGHTEIDPASFSIENPEQTIAARKIVEAFEKRDPGGTVVICLYSFQAERLKQSLKEVGLNVPIHTTDAFQAQEKKLIVLVTTRTNSTEAPAGNLTSAFLKDSGRATVSISRAQHGMVVIADFSAISEGEVWRRFIEEASRHTPIVGEKYLDLMEIENPSRGAGGVLQDKRGWTIQAAMAEPRQQKAQQGRGGRKCMRCGGFGHLTTDCRRN
uniref:CCHC-type domain-containing protein n=1 Tax=Meloidogyne enterolobii TaxID=390850 RepID=A0A6V7TI80_MELEN|nr:unnamed protein product [Meloidogyne enterolobii]